MVLQFPEIEKVWRCWWVIDSPNLTIPVPALSSTVKLKDSHKLSARFPSHAAIFCVNRGNRFRVTPEYQDFALLEVKVVGATEQQNLKLPGNAARYDIRIDAKDPNKDDVLAYYKDKDKGVPVEVVTTITGPNQIAILQGGLVEASRDLIDKTIKVRTLITYLGALEELPTEKIQSVSAHLVGKWKNGTIRYLLLGNGRLLCDGTNVLQLCDWKITREEAIWS